MENPRITIKIVSFKRPQKKDLTKTLFYIKKLIALPSNNDDTIFLETRGLSTELVVSLNEPFNWSINDGQYCQIICLTTKSEILTDMILWFNHLLNFVSKPNTNLNSCSNQGFCITLEGDYQCELDLELINGISSVCSILSSENDNPSDKIASRQPVMGHLMKFKQFNTPVQCAICDGFICVSDNQSFQCVQCLLVTHKKCHRNIPFWCGKSPFANKETIPLHENVRLKFHIPHKFKRYDLPIFRAIIASNHSYCNHCGLQITRNALKCSQCNFTVHKDCQSNVPAMCTISYSSVSKVIQTNWDRVKIVKQQNSSSSSFDLSWLDSLPEFPLEHQQKISLPKFSDFIYIGRLGDGACAQVYCVQHILSKKYFAIKVADGKNEQARQQLEVEKQILFRYSDGNPYMVKAYCAFHQGSSLFLVIELVQGGTLCQKIQTMRMSEDDIRIYLAQIISVLQYLHSKHIVYRDLKLEHALVSSNGSIRLIDYGLGRLLKTPNEHCHTFCGTYSYMAPEVRRLANSASNVGYSYPVDFWALGIMLVQMLCGEQIDIYHQFFANNPEDINQTETIIQNLELPSFISSEAHSCVIGLLEDNPEKRLGSPNSPHGSIRDHPFFRAGHRIDWQEIDEDLMKPAHQTSIIKSILSNSSTQDPLSELQLDKEGSAKVNWITAGQSTCTASENERFKSFDYITPTSYLEFI